MDPRRDVDAWGRGMVGVAVVGWREGLRVWEAVSVVEREVTVDAEEEDRRVREGLRGRSKGKYDCEDGGTAMDERREKELGTDPDPGLLVLLFG